MNKSFHIIQNKNLINEKTIHKLCDNFGVIDGDSFLVPFEKNKNNDFIEDFTKHQANIIAKKYNFVVVKSAEGVTGHEIIYYYVSRYDFIAPGYWDKD